MRDYKEKQARGDNINKFLSEFVKIWNKLEPVEQEGFKKTLASIGKELDKYKPILDSFRS